MNQPADCLTLIKSAFHSQDRIIDRVYRDSESFRSLCEDYAACSAALRRWKLQGSEEARLRQQEYSQLLVDLDREIQSWLEAETQDRKPQEEVQ